MSDAGITILVTIATVGPELAERRPWWVLGLALLASVPLFWRRRAPLTTLWAVGSGIIVLACTHALPPLPYGTVVCAYTIAAYGGPAVRVVAMIAGVLGILVSLVLPGEPPESYAYAALSFLTAWTLGTVVRARRTQIDLLSERALRLDEERVAAVARERVRIARDVHDIVTHSLGLIIVQAETGPLLTRTDPDRADATFAGIADTGRSAVHELRLSLAAMRDGLATGPEGLATAHDSLAGTYAGAPRHQPGLDAIPDLVDTCERGGLTATLDEKGDRRTVSGETGVTAYRVVQQALTNTLEHARADHVAVTLHWTESHLTVRVSDNGATTGTSGDGITARDNGIAAVRRRLRAPEPGRRTGSGLTGMRERVTACGGSLHAGRTETGFTVAAELPLDREP
ncbi:sensor histidine kinase [Nocardia sp. NPDC020380]|uniref:sensor histidine kinase n=1 Tax=Nocardia sp. NPDC020380 TaxID=3364309 RepID=UPI0037930CFF